VKPASDVRQAAYTLEAVVAYYYFVRF
jgi:hypothetical protein